MRAGDDHRPDLCLEEAVQLGRDTLDRTPRLGVRVEEIAADQEEVDLLGDRKIDGRDEGRELSLSLCGCPIAEVRMAGAEVNVSGVQESEHAELEPPLAWSPGRNGCYVGFAGLGCVLVTRISDAGSGVEIGALRSATTFPDAVDAFRV
jgi:hypothetical protein